MDTIYSIIPKDERQMVIGAISLVEDERFDEAIEECTRIINGGYSREAQAFARYAAALSHSRRLAQQDQGQPGDVDVAIRHYELCLRELKFGDAYLMLGYALVQKMGLLQEKPVDVVHYYSQMLDLALRAVAAFDEVRQMDAGLRKYAMEETTRLQPIIVGLRAKLATFN